jgi:spoIIIJ-associated protein
MSSRERRMLHLALKAFDNIETASTGEGLGRFVVAYPKGSPLARAAAEASRRDTRRPFGDRRPGRGPSDRSRSDRRPPRRD